MNVLSVDYDYFQNVDEKTLLTCYPDGLDLPTELSSFTWCGYYANSKTEERLLKVTTLNDEYDNLIEVLFGQRGSIPVMVACSHKFIYPFVLAESKRRGDKHLCLTNVDMHHDRFNSGSKKLDCGNWVLFFEKKFKHFEYKWIANPVSKEAVGCTKEDLAAIKSTTVSSLIGEKYDMIFICRSDNWLPPHLDKGFDDLFTFIKENFINVMYDKQIEFPRDIAGQVEAERQILKELNSFNFKKGENK